MTDIEKAIAVMQEKRDGAEWLDCMNPDIEAYDTALYALRAQQSREAEPVVLTMERFEEICEAVHDGWWEEKKRQGATYHPDMIPYAELPEAVKDYDRITVRRVLDALEIAYDRPPKEPTP